MHGLSWKIREFGKVPNVIIVYEQQPRSSTAETVTVYIFSRAAWELAANLRCISPRKATQVHHGASSPHSHSRIAASRHPTWQPAGANLLQRWRLQGLPP